MNLEELGILALGALLLALAVLGVSRVVRRAVRDGVRDAQGGPTGSRP